MGCALLVLEDALEITLAAELPVLAGFGIVLDAELLAGK